MRKHTSGNLAIWWEKQDRNQDVQEIESAKIENMALIRKEISRIQAYLHENLVLLCEEWNEE